MREIELKPSRLLGLLLARQRRWRRSVSPARASNGTGAASSAERVDGETVTRSISRLRTLAAKHG
jgi:hypothetical protein